MPVIAQKKIPASNRGFRLWPGREKRIAYGMRERHCVRAIRIAWDFPGSLGEEGFVGRFLRRR